MRSNPLTRIQVIQTLAERQVVIADLIVVIPSRGFRSFRQTSMKTKTAKLVMSSNPLTRIQVIQTPALLRCIGMRHSARFAR